jgi:hypothetical protein
MTDAMEEGSWSTTTTYASPNVKAHEVLHNTVLFDPNYMGTFFIPY